MIALCAVFGLVVCLGYTVKHSSQVSDYQLITLRTLTSRCRLVITIIIIDSYQMFIPVCFTCLCGGAARSEKFTSVNTDVITLRRLSTNHRATAVFACVAINMPIMSFLSS